MKLKRYYRFVIIPTRITIRRRKDKKEGTKRKKEIGEIQFRSNLI